MRPDGPEGIDGGGGPGGGGGGRCIISEGDTGEGNG